MFCSIFTAFKLEWQYTQILDYKWHCDYVTQETLGNGHENVLKININKQKTIQEKLLETITWTRNMWFNALEQNQTEEPNWRVWRRVAMLVCFHDVTCRWRAKINERHAERDLNRLGQTLLSLKSNKIKHLKCRIVFCQRNKLLGHSASLELKNKLVSVQTRKLGGVDKLMSLNLASQ